MKNVQVLKVQRNISNRKIKDSWIHAVMFIWMLMCILPFLLVVAVSFTDESALNIYGYRFIPKEFSLEAYKYLFKNPESIIRGYAITIFTCIVGTAIGIIMTSMMAYVLSRKDYPGRKILNIYTVITMLFNGGLVPWYLVYTNVFDFKDSILALLIPNMLVGGFNIIVMRTFFTNTVPDSIIESAYIDGAGEFLIYRKIILPLSLPVVAAISFMTVLGYWNNWYNSMVFINAPEMYSLQYLMTRAILNLQALKAAMQAGGTAEQAAIIADMPSNSVRMAMAVVGTGPMVFLFPFAQKYFVQGLTVGAVKG